MGFLYKALLCITNTIIIPTITTEYYCSCSCTTTVCCMSLCRSSLGQRLEQEGSDVVLSSKGSTLGSKEHTFSMKKVAECFNHLLLAGIVLRCNT